MSKFYRDDVTGEEYQSKGDLLEYGLYSNGMCFDTFDVHIDTIDESPDEVAEKLHDLVDEWLEACQ